MPKISLKKMQMLYQEWDALLSVYADLKKVGKIVARKRIKEIVRALSS